MKEMEQAHQEFYGFPMRLFQSDELRRVIALAFLRWDE